MKAVQRATVSEKLYRPAVNLIDNDGIAGLAAVEPVRPTPLLLVYVGAVCAVGLALTLWASYALTPTPKTLGIFGALFVACLVAEFMPTRHRLNGTDTPSTAIQIAGFALFGHPVIILASVSAMVVSEIVNKRTPLKLFFNAAQIAIIIFIGYQVYNYAYQSSDGDLLARALSLGLGGAALVVANSLLLAGAVSLSSGMRAVDCFLTHCQDMWLPKAAQIALGFLIVIVYESEPLAVLMLAFPFLAVQHAMKYMVALRDETRSTIEALADAVDKRDETTSRHSLRVATYAEEIAKEMDLPPDEIELIRSAARVHDLGKIAIADDILNKAGPLDMGEREQMMRHPATGAGIVESLSLYKEVLPVIRLHHERYDGMGYPDGRAGEHTPIGARIIAVADAYDAMTSDRPYREAMGEDFAIGQLLEHSGRQFDPEVVRAFVSLFRRGYFRNLGR